MQYVIVITFDEKVNERIKRIQKFLDENKVKNLVGDWKNHPHVTLGLFENIDKEQIIKSVDKNIRKFKPFEIRFKGLNNFKNQVLYFELEKNENITKMREAFLTELENYQSRLEKSRDYVPHMTILKNENVTGYENLIKTKTKAFIAPAIAISLFEREPKKLIKEWQL